MTSEVHPRPRWIALPPQRTAQRAGQPLMTQTIHCPSCQRMLRVPDSLLGQAVKCPSCQQTFNAPENADSIPLPRPAGRSAPSRPTFEEEEDRPEAR
jgi:predicted Zn finger-like uncharacterized protein